MDDIDEPTFSEHTQGQSSFILLPSQEETQQESQVDKQMVKILRKLPALQVSRAAVLVSDTDSVSKTDVNNDPSDIASDSDLEEDVTFIQKKSGERTIEESESETQKGVKSAGSSSGSNGSSFQSRNRSNLGSYDQCEVYKTQKGHAKGDRFDLFPASQDMFAETEDNGYTSTPAEHLASLHLSQKPMLVPETVDDIVNEIPPSPGVYGSTPIIIPSSPTQEEGYQSIGNRSCHSEDGNQTMFDVNAAETLASQPKQGDSFENDDQEHVTPTSSGKKKQTSQSSSKLSEDNPAHESGNSESIHLNLSAGTFNTDEKNVDQKRRKTRQARNLQPPPSSQKLLIPESCGREMDVIVISESGSVTSEKEEPACDELRNLQPPPSSQKLLIPESCGREMDVIVISESGSVTSEKEVEESDDLVLHLSLSETGTTQGQRSQLPKARASSQFIDEENRNMEASQKNLKSSQKNSQGKPSSQDNTARAQGSQESRPQSRGQSSGSEPRSQNKRKTKREKEIQQMNDNPLVEWNNESDTERKEEMSVKSSYRFLDEFHLAMPGDMSMREPDVARETEEPASQKLRSSQKTTSQPQAAQDCLRDSMFETLKLVSVPVGEQDGDKLSIGMIQSESEHTEPVFKLQRPHMEEVNLLEESEEMFPRLKARQKAHTRLIIEDSDDDYNFNTHTGDTEEIVSSDVGNKFTRLDDPEEIFVATKLKMADESTEMTQSYHAAVGLQTDVNDNREKEQFDEHLETINLPKSVNASVEGGEMTRIRRLMESSAQTADGKVSDAFDTDINVDQKVAEYLQAGYTPRSRSNSTCTDLSDLHCDGSEKGDNLMKTPHRKDRTEKLRTAASLSRSNSTDQRSPKSPHEIQTIIKTYSDILSKSQKHKQKTDDKMLSSSQKPNAAEPDTGKKGKLAPRRLSSQSLPEDLLGSKSRTPGGNLIGVSDPWMTARKPPSQLSIESDAKSDKLSELNSPGREIPHIVETGVTQELSESFRPDNDLVSNEAAYICQENETTVEIKTLQEKLNKGQDDISDEPTVKATAKKDLPINLESMIGYDSPRMSHLKESNSSENILHGEKSAFTPSKQNKSGVKTSPPFLTLERVDSPKKFLSDSVKHTSGDKSDVYLGTENEDFGHKTVVPITTPNKQKSISLKAKETLIVAAEKQKTISAKDKEKLVTLSQPPVLSDRVDTLQKKELLLGDKTESVAPELVILESVEDENFAQNKEEMALSQKSRGKTNVNLSPQFAPLQKSDSKDLSSSRTRHINKPYYSKSGRSKKNVKRRLSAEKRNDLHRQASGLSPQAVSNAGSLPATSSRVSPQTVSGSFVASTQKFSPNNPGEGQDPYGFHGTQSQASPAKEMLGNGGNIPGKTPLSSRKRAKLQHKKSGLKKARQDAEDAENSSQSRHHVSFVNSPRQLSQSSDTMVTTIGSLPSIPSSISQTSPMREAVLSPTSSGSSRQSVSEEISTRLSGKRMSIEQVLPDTLPLTHSEEDNYQMVTVVIEKVERVYREITTTKKVIGPQGLVLENTQDVKRLDPVIVEENTHKKVQYHYIPSPSRSVSSLTSGDLADVSSSLSRSSVSSGSLGSKVGSLSSSLDRNPSVTKHLETQISHEQSQSDLSHGETEKSNTGEIMTAPAAAPKSRYHRLSSDKVSENQTSANEKTKQQHGQALENQTDTVTGIQPQTPETLNTGYQKEQTPGPNNEKEHQSKPGTPAVQSDQEISDVQTPLGSTINKSSSYLHSRTSSVESPKASDSLFSTSSDENKKPASNRGAGKSRKRANVGSRSDISTKGNRSSDQISSEIPYQDQHVSSSQSATPEEPFAMATSDGTIGSKVMAKWKDDYFYPGILKTKGDRNGKHLVHFDDGSKMSVKGSDILLIERLPLGQSVMVLTEDGDFGLIKKSGNDNYTVETDEGLSGRYTSSQVILSSDQAECIVSDHGNDVVMAHNTHVMVPNNIGDVSLENLLDAPRRSATKKPVESEVKVDDEGQGPSGKGRKRKHDSLKPQATSTPTPKGKSESLLTKRRKVLVDSPVAGIQSSPVSMLRRPARKTRVGLFGKGLGPIPKKKIFRNIYFLLTNVEKSKEQHDQEKKLIQDSSLDTSTDESAAEEDGDVPFDKEQLRQQIEGGGGIVLDSLDENLVSTGKRKIILLSSTYQRTIKYLQCLACGIPCLSHMWVVDSCTQEHLLDDKSYVLPAGISLEKRKVMEWRKKHDVFQGINAVVYSDNNRFVDSWRQIMSLAQCHVYEQVQYSNVHVIVTDNSCRTTIKRVAESHCIPLVGTEWVIQCLVNGRVMSYTGHPRYKYDCWI